MTMVGVDDNSLQADSEPESIDLVWGLAVAQRWVYINQMDRLLDTTMPAS